MASIQGVYVALFGRPADPAGLSFFNTATKNGADLAAIGDLAATAEYQGRFTGQTNTQVVTTIFKSLFVRDPDQAGLTFFADALTNKTLTINNVAIAIFDGAKGFDVGVRDAKVAAANAFTAAIDTQAEIAAYKGTAASTAGFFFLGSVTSVIPDTAAINRAIADIVANAPKASPAPQSLQTPFEEPQTITLTGVTTDAPDGHLFYGA